MARQAGRSGWLRCLPGVTPDRRWRSWLAEPGSLTARCQRHCRQFQVRVLRQGRLAGLASDGPRARLPAREVLLECDGVPVIFAHSVLSTARSGRLAEWFAGLGSRSLGSLLFAHAGFRREAIEFIRIDRFHPLHRRVCQAAGTDLPEFWGRRSRHHLGRDSVLVIEVFLPAIRALR